MENFIFCAMMAFLFLQLDGWNEEYTRKDFVLDEFKSDIVKRICWMHSPLPTPFLYTERRLNVYDVQKTSWTSAALLKTNSKKSIFVHYLMSINDMQLVSRNSPSLRQKIFPFIAATNWIVFTLRWSVKICFCSDFLIFRKSLDEGRKQEGV